MARKALGLLVAQIADIEAKAGVLDAEILAWRKADAISQRLASIHRYIRRLLVVGATAMIAQARRKKSAASAWLVKLLEAKPARLVSVALANKMARVAWAVLARGTVYQIPAPVTA